LTMLGMDPADRDTLLRQLMAERWPRARDVETEARTTPARPPRRLVRVTDPRRTTYERRRRLLRSMS